MAVNWPLGPLRINSYSLYAWRYNKMGTLNYANPENIQPGASRSAVIFAPFAIAIALYAVCALGFQGAIAAYVVIGALAVAEILTITFLCLWRRQLFLFSVLVGWSLAAVMALFLAFIAVADLGLLRL